VTSILDLPFLGNDSDRPFPPTAEALGSPNGLLAWGGDLQPERLLTAYRSGIFPWYSDEQPILWWSPVPRCVIFPDKVYLSRRTRRRYNSGVYRLSADSAFAEVISGCAEPRGLASGTWITQEMLEAYIHLHQLGHAHSLEVWEEDLLVGGIYGLAIGSVFFGESMFSRRTDASKIALVALCRQLHGRGYGLLDCQVGNPHLHSMGAEELERGAFEALLADLIEKPQPGGSWQDLFEFDQRWL
jgi:leucyl/phenylalanyl-tRNA--protein transferase